MRTKGLILFLIPIAVAAVFSAANLLKLYRSVDAKLYDFLLRMKSPVPEADAILMLDIDDVAISRVGVFPWSRDIMADGLIRMKEFDARYAVFDIEYTETSPRGINEGILRERIPERFAEEFQRIEANAANLFKAIQSGDIPLGEAQDYVGFFAEEAADAEHRLLEEVARIERNNDEYLGKAARFFGNTFFTVNMLPDPDPTVNPAARDCAAAAVALRNITADPRGLRAEQKARDVKPAILPILSNARGAGFVNVVVDEDGVRRRIDLVMEYEGNYYPQLAFSALLHWFGEPATELRQGSFIIRDAELPDGARKTLRVPLAPGKSVLIHWPRQEYLKSFRHLSFWKLVQHDELESRLLHNLRIMDELGYLRYHAGTGNLLDLYEYADGLQGDMLEGTVSNGIEEYQAARNLFFQETAEFLAGTAEADILADLDGILAGDLEAEERALYSDFRRRVPEDFGATRDVWDTLKETRELLAAELPGAFCIIGLIGTSTTDIGVTPMVEKYMNVGTHASLVNAILHESFLDETPLYYTLIAAFLFSLLVTGVIRNLAPLPSIVAGVGVLFVLGAAASTLFLVSGRYVNLLTPMLSVFFTFIVISLMKFLRTEREKSFLRNAFSHYLSTDVVNQLIADPERLNLGGESKYLTAMFTDIRGFTSISEALDPTDLVRLLNAYLTKMSDVILNLKGTIDKYEGDAIISFFGAPVDFEDHPRRACLAAVRMKNAERILNRHFLNEKLSPAPLLTRVGINTGSMIVGNMGTPQKMDYTVMGSSVNLASRLEGVNKQYGTWILISELTRREVGDEFAVRRLDLVRPAGFKNPVRLYELIDEKSETDVSTLAAVEVFDEGVKNFEEKEWQKALVNFNEVRRLLPQDGPSGIYIRRCEAYLKNPPPQSWDGIFNLPMK